MKEGFIFRNHARKRLVVNAGTFCSIFLKRDGNDAEIRVVGMSGKTGYGWFGESGFFEPGRFDFRWCPDECFLGVFLQAVSSGSKVASLGEDQGGGMARGDR